VLVATAAPAPDAALPPAGDAGPVGSALASPGAGSTAAADAPADSAATGTTSDAAAPAAPAPDPGAAVPAVVVGTPTGSSTAPVPAAAPATPAQPVGSQLAQPVAVLASRPDGVHTVTVVLHPDDLGPVQVQVTVRGGSVDLHLAGAHEHGRAALLEALPDLRRDLQGAGISCSRMDVSRDTGGSWTSHQQSAGQSWQQGSQQRGPAPGEGRPGGPWLRTPDRGRSRPAPPSSSSASQGVDLLV